jgi:hypothetical protein
MFEDYSILVLISIILGSLGLLVPGFILIFKCIRKKLKFTEKDLQDAMLSFKYYSMKDDYSDDIELLDEDVVMGLDKEAGIGKYEDAGSRSKKMKEAAKRTKGRVDILSSKKNKSRIISIIEGLIIGAHNVSVIGVLIAGFIVVAQAQYVGDVSDTVPDSAKYATTILDVDYYTLGCAEAADLGLCTVSQSTTKYSYEVKGFKVRTNQNCKIGGDESENWAAECSNNHFCSYQRGNTKCNSYCFGGYDSVTRVDLDVVVTPVNVLFAYDCDSMHKKSTINCPYGFIQRNSSYYCLNNDGSINDHWFILDEMDDLKFTSLYKFPETKLCEADYHFTYRTTSEHVDPNQCKLYYGKKSEGEKPTNRCTEIKPVPVNSTHNLLYCDTECVVSKPDSWEFPCGSLVSKEDPMYQNCMYVPTGGSKYGSGCPQFDPSTTNGTLPDIKVLPKSETSNGKPLSSFQKMPRYIWLCALVFFQCLVLGFEVWLF